MEMLEKSDVRIIERYPNFALVETTAKAYGELKKGKFEGVKVDNTILLKRYKFDPLE
ncbi:MAG: hypothetical protein QXJ27_03225 [Thermoplasmata archaeon]